MYNCTYVFLLMYLCTYLHWRKYNRIPSVGITIDAKSIPAPSIIVRPSGCDLHGNNAARSARAKELDQVNTPKTGEGTTPPPTLPKTLNNSKTAAQSATVFDIPSQASIWHLRWKFERDCWISFALYRFLWRHYAPILVEKCKNVWKFVKNRV